MTRLAALAAVLVLAPALAPLADAAEAHEPYPFPEDYVAKSRAWIAAARADVAIHEDASWYPDVVDLLDSADAYADDGRAYAAAQAVVNARVAVAFHSLWEDVKPLSESGKRARVQSQADAWDAAADRAASAYRRDLDDLEAKLTSLVALEAALYSADWFVEADHAQNVYPVFREDINSDQFDAGLVLGIAGVTVGAEWRYRYAIDLLPLAAAREGVTPLFKAQLFQNLTLVARMPPSASGFSPPHTRSYDALAASTNATDEDVLAAAAFLAVGRAQGVANLQAQYGDAASRGVGAEADMRDGINASLAKDTLARYTDVGYEGLFAMAGKDQAIYTLEQDYQGLAELSGAWMSIEHAHNFLASIFANLSPVPRPEVNSGSGTEAAGTPIALVAAGGLVVAGAAVGGLAYAARRRG